MALTSKDFLRAENLWTLSDASIFVMTLGMARNCSSSDPLSRLEPAIEQYIHTTS